MRPPLKCSAKAPSSVFFERACAGHGVCRHGTCFCDPGYDGANCSLVLPCPHGCSGHGLCVHGACFCEPGYEASDCSLAPPDESATLKIILLGCAGMSCQRASRGKGRAVVRG